MTGSFAAPLLFMACVPRGSSGSEPAPADGNGDADTDTTHTASPTSLVATCTQTDNVLRYQCDVTVDPPQAVQISWVRDDGLGPVRVHTSDLAQGSHLLDVYYLAAGADYTVVATATAWPDGLSSTIGLTTGTPPNAVDGALQLTGTATAGLLGTEAPCGRGAYAVIYDTTTGDVVWYHDLDPSGSLGMIDMVRFTDDRTIIGETNGNIVEVDLMGNDLVRFPVSYALNHDIFEAGGLYYSQFQHEVDGLILDNVVAIDTYGVEQWQWDPADFLSIPGGARGDYLHANSIYVDADGNFYLSWLSIDAVGKFVGDRAAPHWGEALWLMTGDGKPGDLGNDIAVDWSDIGGPDEFGAQHNVHLRHDGRLMLLDNQNGRGLVLSVDEATLTATVDAEYPTHEPNCFAQGTAMDTVAGNAVVACGTGWVREFDLATSALVWEAEIVCRNGGGAGLSPGGAVRWYPLDAWE